MNVGKIIDYLIGQANGLKIQKAQMLRLNEGLAQELFPQVARQGYFKEVEKFLCSDVVVGLEIVGENSIAQVKDICGPENPITAKQEQPATIRALFGFDSIKNAVHRSEDAQMSEQERAIFFGDRARHECYSALLTNCTLCLIKPHILQSGQTGKIIDKILDDGFEISAM